MSKSGSVFMSVEGSTPWLGCTSPKAAIISSNEALMIIEWGHAFEAVVLVFWMPHIGVCQATIVHLT